MLHIERNDMESGNNNLYFKQLAKKLDDMIISSYQLWNNNYIAYDILNNTTRFLDYYTIEEKSQFIDYMNEGIDKINIVGDIADYKYEMKDIFLHIYANPVFNKLNINTNEDIF